jgi:hypothetical protein
MSWHQWPAREHGYELRPSTLTRMPGMAARRKTDREMPSTNAPAASSTWDGLACHAWTSPVSSPCVTGPAAASATGGAAAAAAATAAAATGAAAAAAAGAALQGLRVAGSLGRCCMHRPSPCGCLIPATRRCGRVVRDGATCLKLDRLLSYLTRGRSSPAHRACMMLDQIAGVLKRGSTAQHIKH